MINLDRIVELEDQNQLTGIDFIYVHPDQVTLDVYFLTAPDKLKDSLSGAVSPEVIRIYSPTVTAPDIPVTRFSWESVADRDVLRLVTEIPGDFTPYKLLIKDNHLDPYYNDVDFSFKANCPSDLDCAYPIHDCPPEEAVDIPIDYLARDFWSFRQALLEMAATRYPDWPDRLEADAGIMLTEVLSALGDEMAYYQDRIGREAYLETATQRRSLRRHALLVDYPLHDAFGARTWLDITMKRPNAQEEDEDSNDQGQEENEQTKVVLAGTDISAIGDDGVSVHFEVGQNIIEMIKETSYPVDFDRNEFRPHLWDEDDLCLPVGATELHIQGHRAKHFEAEDQKEDEPKIQYNKWVLLQTQPQNPAQPTRAHMVRVIKAVDTIDPILEDPHNPGENAPITHLTWEKEQALPYELDLTSLQVRANLVPAVAGKMCTAYFIICPTDDGLTEEEWEALQSSAENQEIHRAVERAGRGGSITYLFTLPGSDQMPLVWLGDHPRYAEPEIELREMHYKSGNNRWEVQTDKWIYQRSLIGVNSSQPLDPHYTLDDGSWRRVVGYQRDGEEFVFQDYASNEGVTIRFGDGEFGQIPRSNTVFKVFYRLGGSAKSNLAIGALKNKGSFPDFVHRVTNPLPATGGLDAETSAQLRQLAPEAFRAVTYRAVRPEDYAEAAERLPWVQKAGASFRWTGSWLSAFVTPDPQRAFRLGDNRDRELSKHLDRFRQAGREAHVRQPRYANIDLKIDICASASAYAGEVKARVMEALYGKDGLSGYFGPDRFTFGTELDRSTLEAHIQAVSGVRSVDRIRYRRQGWFDWQIFQALTYEPGSNVIIRIANNPLQPGWGTLNLYVKGGA